MLKKVQPTTDSFVVAKPTENSVLYHAFPTPIYANKVDDYDLIQEEISNVIPDIGFAMRDDWGETHWLSDVTFRSNFISDYKLKHLTNAIHINIYNYLNAIDFGSNGNAYGADGIDYNILSSWVALYKKGNYAHIHNHSHHDISGVYYYKMSQQQKDKTGCGDISFHTPAPSSETSFVFHHYSYPKLVDIEQGVMLLFPSYLKHGVSTNSEDEERISVSFNVKFNTMKQ